MVHSTDSYGVRAVCQARATGKAARLLSSGRSHPEEDQVQPFLPMPPWWDLRQETDHWFQLLSELPFHRKES